MPNENENTSNELDDLFTTSDSSEGDDFFSLGDTGAETTDDSGSIDIDVESNPFETSDSTSNDDSPFGFPSTGDAPSDDPFGLPPTGDVPSGDSPFVMPVEEAPEIPPTPAPVETGKKGKKGKKEKAPKEPKAKGAKKEKAPKEPKAPKAPKAPKEPKVKRPYVVSPFPFLVLFFVLALIVACIVVAAFAICGGGAVTFLIPAGILAIIMLLVPFMLLSHLRKEPVGLFDMFMAIAAIFSVLSAIVILAYQSKTYGASSKVALNAPAVVASLDC